MKPPHTQPKLIYGNPLSEEIHDPYHIRGKSRGRHA